MLFRASSSIMPLATRTSAARERHGARVMWRQPSCESEYETRGGVISMWPEMAAAVTSMHAERRAHTPRYPRGMPEPLVLQYYIRILQLRSSDTGVSPRV
jgi:hypothetical protein